MDHPTLITASKAPSVRESADLTPMRPKDRTAEFKLQDEWKIQILSGLSSGAAIAKKEKVGQQQALTELKKLKSDLHRKDLYCICISLLLHYRYDTRIFLLMQKPGFSFSLHFK